MTNKEALISVISPFEADDNTLEKNLLDNDINPNENYSKDLSKDIDISAIAILEGMLALNSVSEGGYRMGFNYEGVKSRLLILAKKHNLTDVISRNSPTITSVDKW